jgi:single-strand DNA-binding protein
MLQLSLAGRCGRDAEYKQTLGGAELCSFPVAADVGYGDSKQTIWVDVTRWGKGAQGLANCIRKGDPVAVTGEMSTREHDGKTYVQCRADRVTLLGSKGDGRGERKREADNGGWVGQAPDSLDDDLPAF